MFGISRSAITLFGFDVHFYGLIIAAGVFLAVLLASAREKRLGLKKETALNVALVCLPAAILCARLYYVVFSWEYYAAHPGDIFNIRQGGLAVYGGIIGGVLTGIIFCRIKKIPVSSGLDLAAPSIALGQAVGRWGNFINQEAYGRLVENPALKFFPVSVNIGGAWHYATFFYESIWCALVVVFLLVAENKHFFRRRGDIFGAYVFLYGLERALVEGLRTDSLYIGPVRVSQMISLLAVLAVALVLARRESRYAKAVRFLPAAAAVLLGICLAMELHLFSTVLTLALPGLAAVIYIGSYKTMDD